MYVYARRLLSQKHSQSFIKLVHYVHKNNVFTLECNTVRGRHIDTSIRPPIELTIYITLLFVVRVGPRARRLYQAKCYMPHI